MRTVAAETGGISSDTIDVAQVSRRVHGVTNHGAASAPLARANARSRRLQRTIAASRSGTEPLLDRRRVFSFAARYGGLTPCLDHFLQRGIARVALRGAAPIMSI